MPLNKLENFIKNAEGRILYVNPNDLDSTDGIENQGNSLTKPFKTIQRALLESARFSYLRGDDNDLVEKTTILVFPGEHLIDNRPGFAIRSDAGTATAVSPSGVASAAQNTLTLTLNSNFDLTQEDNILYKFNSVNGGIIIPRGTSIVGLDLRKTKIRPKYVPNPTDPNTPNSAIFRVTGACYFWQFTFFDGDEKELVYTDPKDFSTNNQSKPTFSHHKLTCFEYGDGVNIPAGYDLTDLDMYYSKISNAFNRASGREIDQKYPEDPDSFAKQRPEWEIVGAFASDPLEITNLISGDGATPGTIVTVTTALPHNLTAGTPIKIRGVDPKDYNISTKVTQVISETSFTYLLQEVRPNLPAGRGSGLTIGGANVTIETDTVSGASPYIFNVSLRSVYGMAGMHADGSKADGFRSMVVAQFTAVSLQKDDRAFVEYDISSRQWNGKGVGTPVYGEKLSAESSATETSQVYHLNPDAVYRDGWKTTHVKMSNDAVIQIVSVFAIGFHKHFECLSGGDASITNSNSNFGQFSLAADGFKKDAFKKDDKGFVTGVVTPRSIPGVETAIEWVQFDITKTQSVGKSGHLYLLGYNKQDVIPPIISQGYRIGARVDDKVYLKDANGVLKGAKILMTNGPVTSSAPTAAGAATSAKVFSNITVQNDSARGGQTFYTIGAHTLKNGESIRIFSETGDLPEGLDPNKIYYAVTSGKNASRTDNISLTALEIQIAASRTNAEAQIPITIKSYEGVQLRIESRVSDKKAYELGHPVQWDPNNNHWFVHVETSSDLYTHITTTLHNAGETESDISIVHRKEDDRSLDEKIYKLRYVVPKELENTRDPVSSFVLQDSSSTNVRSKADFGLASIDSNDYDFDRNPRFITTCTHDTVNDLIEFRTAAPHNLKIGDKVIVTDVKSTNNPNATVGIGFNGTFFVDSVSTDKDFKVTEDDVFGVTHDPGVFNSLINQRSGDLPRIQRNDTGDNFYIYRVETITPYQQNIQDGVYYLYVLNAGNQMPQTGENFKDKYSQNVTDLYPQLDRDNTDDNPDAAVSFSKRSPLGDVVTNDLKRSLTRETVDKFFTTFDLGHKIASVTDNATTAALTFDREHQLDGVVEYTSLNGTGSHTEGTYFNVRLLNDSNNDWQGATADVVVDSSGNVTSASIVEGGSGYDDAQVLYFDNAQIGGTKGATITINSAGISTSAGNYVQLTGIGTATDSYHRITDVTDKKSIVIAKTAADPTPNVNQYAINLGRAVYLERTVAFSNGIDTLDSINGPHGLVAGNAIRIVDTTNGNLGDHIVANVPSPTRFTIETTAALSNPQWAFKHGMSANNASADTLGENFAVRTLTAFDNETLILSADPGTSDKLQITLPNAGIGTMKRFQLGSYVQVDNEIMRIRTATLDGTNNDQLTVIRGSMGTSVETHVAGSLVKKIKLNSIELRRPSILRASGHTFEYLGYGPGNYSTGLPQVQLKTLTEQEDFLAQSQETSCGTVLYTGMNSDGDFYIGNTKYSAQSGEQTTFDVPTPTITGEDPNRLSVVFDEVIVKERILVEGGQSKQILSQFDGPVTFSGNVRITNTLNLNADLRVGDQGTVTLLNADQSTSCTTGAMVVAGGVGIGKNVNICGTLTVAGESTFNSKINVNGDIDIRDDDKILLGDNDDFEIYHDGSGTGPAATANNTYFKDNNANGGTIFLTSHFIGRNAADTEFTFDAIENGGVRLYYDGNSKIETTNGGGIVRGDLEVTEDLQVNQSGTINDNLTVGGSLSCGSLSVNGNITATGDISAFVSDDRLKTNKVEISNALDKVCSLNGFTYTLNDLAGTFGYDVTQRHAGVSAQEVEKVLPEVITQAGIDDEYMSVKYDKLVPLLIEAIKDLKAEIDELKSNK